MLYHAEPRLRIPLQAWCPSRVMHPSGESAERCDPDACLACSPPSLQPRRRAPHSGSRTLRASAHLAGAHADGAPGQRLHRRVQLIGRRTQQPFDHARSGGRRAARTPRASQRPRRVILRDGDGVSCLRAGDPMLNHLERVLVGPSRGDSFRVMVRMVGCRRRLRGTLQRDWPDRGSDRSSR